MREKIINTETIKINVPESLNRSITNDMHNFEVFKRDGETVNFNGFMSSLIAGYYERYQEEISEQTKRTEGLLSKYIKDKKQLEQATSDIIVEELTSETHEKKETNSKSLKFRSTTETDGIILEIEEKLESAKKKTSGFFRMMLFSYSRNPVFVRERIIYYRNTDVIEEACRSGKEITFTIRDNPSFLHITQQINSSSKRFDRKDLQLNDALDIIKGYEYSIIIIMDEFHNMGRNSDVGFSQYNYLRSLNELSLVYYWTISDSDFSDEYATKQFKTSFFVQNFNPKTVPQLNKEEMFQLLDDKAKRNGIQLSNPVKESIYEIIGGIPGFVLPTVKCIKGLGFYDESQFDKDKLIKYLLEDITCLSFINSWSRSLTVDQKEILLGFSETDKKYEDEISTPLREINELGDKCGLGLLINGSDEKGSYWRINTELFREFILSKSDQFFAADVVPPAKDDEVIVQQAPTYHIQNNYFTVNNNFFNPDSAVKSLLFLKEIASKGQLLIPDQARITDAIQCLPYQQPEWEQMEEKEKDEQMDEYADKLFTSGDFRVDSLTEKQMSEFFLTQSLLDKLSDTSRDNLISAIQVYDILKICENKIGLNLLNSQSARGILFARLYESILKERLCPAFSSVNNIASIEIRLDQITYFVKDAPPEKMTIGNFAYVLKVPATQQALASICTKEIGRSSCDRQWWREHRSRMNEIGRLRNECSHGGTNFDISKLQSLIHYIFELHTIDCIEVYDDIANRR